MPFIKACGCYRPRPKFGCEIEVRDSAAVRSLRFDPNSYVLDVTYKRGATYRYREISSRTFAHIVCAKSVGKTLNAWLKGKPSRKLPTR